MPTADVVSTISGTRSTTPPPPTYFEDYLNLAHVQNSLGVDTNYTLDANDDVYFAFQQTGDFVWPNFLDDLESILNRSSVRVSLIYGDADYICNWFGGQAVSLALKFPDAAKFQAANYVPMMVDGVEYGETREYGNFSFTRVYESGHEVPYYQPIASLQLFNRTINHFDIPTGEKKITGTYEPAGGKPRCHAHRDECGAAAVELWEQGEEDGRADGEGLVRGYYPSVSETMCDEKE